MNEKTTQPDLLARLRWLAAEHWAGRHGLSDDMAVEIDRAAAEIERLRAALGRIAVAAQVAAEEDDTYTTPKQSRDVLCAAITREALGVGKPPAKP